MCLAIPSKILSLAHETAVVDINGVQREVCVMLLENPRVGDYVIVHAGFAIQTIDETAAREALSIIKGSLASAVPDNDNPGDAE